MTNRASFGQIFTYSCTVRNCSVPTAGNLPTEATGMQASQ